MKFEFLDLAMNPFILMFLTVVTGILFGKIRFGKFNFGISGTLFTGLLIGWMVFRLGENIVAKGPDAAGYDSAVAMLSAGVVQSSFFDLFLILFVASIGLLAGKDMGVVLKKYGMKFIILGLLVTFVGAGMTYGMTWLSKNSSPYEVAGVYTGALTSSPGLAAALETGNAHASEVAAGFEKMSVAEKNEFLKIADPSGKLNASNTKKLTPELTKKFITEAEAGVGVGHAIGYPFGVLVVILAMNFLPRLFRMNVEKEKERYALEMEEMHKVRGEKSNKIKVIPTGKFSIMAFITTCLLGYLLGEVQIFLGPLGYFSLGATGGVLIMSLFLGHIGKVGIFHFRMDEKILVEIRQIGTAFFLAIVGLRFGYKALSSLAGSGLYLAFVSLVVSIVAVMIGFLLGRYVFKLNWIILAGAICGGMTSTPGLGAAADAIGSDSPASGYGATYPFALLGMVMFTIILHKLPMF